jgi:hypothetical protein
LNHEAHKGHEENEGKGKREKGGSWKVGERNFEWRIGDVLNIIGIKIGPKALDTPG